jgi:hypothetical protein
MLASRGAIKELVDAKDSSPGNVAAGKTYFDQTCMLCHPTASALAKPSRAQILRPKFVDTAPSWKLDRLQDTQTAAARLRHLALLENYSPAGVNNLLVYLQSGK